MMRSSTVLFLLLLSAPALAQTPLPLDTLRVQAASRLIAGAAAATRSVEILERAAIDALPARNLTDVIARGLGVDLLVRSPAQADLSIRGGSFEQVLVLVDGVPVNDRQTGHFHLDTAVPLDAIHRIELLRGPAAAVYGTSAIGGVINIVTRGAEPELSARAQGGSFGSWSAGAEAGHRADRIGARLSLDHDASDGHRPGTDHRTTQARLAAQAAALGGTLRADVGFAARDFGAADFYAPFDSWEETRTATAALGWEGGPTTLSVAPRFSYRQHRDDFILRREDPAFYRNRHTTHLTSAELVARWTAPNALRLAFGAEARRGSIDSNSLGRRAEHEGAVFIEALAGSAATLLLSAGARLDRHETFGTFLSPSAAVAWQAADALGLRASVASGFRAPSWTDRFYVDPANIGSPDLEEERFWTGEVGATLGARSARLDVAAFIRRADDLIDWARPESAPAEEPWRTLNVDRATFRGLEIAGSSGLGPVSFDVRASWLDFETREQPGFVSKYALQPLIRSGSVEATLPLTAVVNMAARAAHFARADGVEWETLDLRTMLRLGGAQIFADVTNLLDDQPLDVSGRPARGRAFSAGLRLRR